MVLAKVAVLAETLCIEEAVVMLAACGLFGSSLSMIAVLTHAVSIVCIIRMSA